MEFLVLPCGLTVYPPMPAACFWCGNTLTSQRRWRREIVYEDGGVHGPDDDCIPCSASVMKGFPRQTDFTALKRKAIWVTFHCVYSGI